MNFVSPFLAAFALMTLHKVSELHFAAIKTSQVESLLTSYRLIGGLGRHDGEADLYPIIRSQKVSNRRTLQRHYALLPDIFKPLPTPIEDEILKCVQLFEYLLRLSPVKKNVRLRSPEWVGSLRVFIATALHRRFDPVVVRGNIRCE